MMIFLYCAFHPKIPKHFTSFLPSSSQAKEHEVTSERKIDTIEQITDAHQKKKSGQMLNHFEISERSLGKQIINCPIDLPPPPLDLRINTCKKSASNLHIYGFLVI